MKRLTIVSLVSVVLALSAAGSALGQEENAVKHRWWLSTHMGPFLGDYIPQSSFGISVNRGRRVLYQLGSSIVSIDSRSRSFELRMTSASLGIAQLHRFYMLSVFAGPSLIRDCVRFDKRTTCRLASAGVSANAQAAFLPFKGIGLGIDLLGAVIPSRSFVSIRVAFVAGGL